VIGREDPEYAELDDFIQAQFALAAETYGRAVDLDTGLRAIEHAQPKGDDDTSAADRRNYQQS
jgi:hypothetical protein